MSRPSDDSIAVTFVRSSSGVAETMLRTVQFGIWVLNFIFASRRGTTHLGISSFRLVRRASRGSAIRKGYRAEPPGLRASDEAGRQLRVQSVRSPMESPAA